MERQEDKTSDSDEDWVMVHDSRAQRLQYDVMDSAECPWCLCDNSTWMRPFMQTWYAVFPVQWTMEETDMWVSRRVKMNMPSLPRVSDSEAQRAARKFATTAPAEWTRRTQNFDIGPADAIRHRRSFDRSSTPDMWQRHRVQHVTLVPLF